MPPTGVESGAVGSQDGSATTLAGRVAVVILPVITMLSVFTIIVILAIRLFQVSEGVIKMVHSGHVVFYHGLGGLLCTEIIF